MAVVNKETVFISGVLNWVKVLDEPVPNYNKDGREWTFEIEPDEKGIELLKKHKIADRLKGKGFKIGERGQHAERNPFLQLKKSEFTRDGNKNTLIRVYDGDDNEWDRAVKIGNGSKGDVKLDIRDYGVGKKSGVYPAAIRVTDHIPYEDKKGPEFGPLNSEDKSKPKKDTFREDFGLDDEIPV